MPGPRPAFRPCFPDDFLQQARRKVRQRTAPFQEVQRCQLALLLFENPSLDNTDAARRVGLSSRQVRRWRQRWAAGDFSISDLPGRGRKHVFSPPR
jgi:hypothetical protein